MKPLHINTPLLEAPSISRKVGRQIFLKMEAFQPTGSFKIRGIGLVCAQLAEKGAKRFVTASAGNAGLALLYTGKKLNIQVTIVVWKDVPETTLEQLRKEGAEIVVYGTDWMEANAFAKSMCHKEGVYFIHPFDHPLLWKGYAGIIHEVKQSDLKPDAIVVSVGGGGLLSGIVQGLHEVDWKNTPVFTAETIGAASLAKSIQAGKLITLEKVDTVALSLGARQVTEQAFAWSQKHSIVPCEVSDAQAVRGLLEFVDDQRTLVEPACGAALALVYDRHPTLMNYEKILIIICGGCGVNLELINKWRHIA